MSKIWAFFVNSAERGFQPILRADVEWIVNTEHVRPGRSYPTLPRDLHIWRATPEVTDACEEWVVGDASESVRPIPPSRRARVRRALLYYYSVITKLYWGRLAGRYSMCRLHWEGGCYAHLSPAVNSLHRGGTQEALRPMSSSRGGERLRAPDLDGNKWTDATGTRTSCEARVLFPETATGGTERMDAPPSSGQLLPVSAETFRLGCILVNAHVECSAS